MFWSASTFISDEDDDNDDDDDDNNVVGDKTSIGHFNTDAELEKPSNFDNFFCILYLTKNQIKKQTNVKVYLPHFR